MRLFSHPAGDDDDGTGPSRRPPARPMTPALCSAPRVRTKRSTATGRSRPPSPRSGSRLQFRRSRLTDVGPLPWEALPEDIFEDEMARFSRLRFTRALTAIRAIGPAFLNWRLAELTGAEEAGALPSRAAPRKPTGTSPFGGRAGPAGRQRDYPRLPSDDMRGQVFRPL